MERGQTAALDIVQDALVVCESPEPPCPARRSVFTQHATMRKASMSSPEIGLIQDSDLGCQHSRSEDLGPLLLTAREALVQVSAGRRICPSASKSIFSYSRLRNSAMGKPDLPLPLPWPPCTASTAVRKKLARLRPEMDTGYWNARNSPKRARSSGVRRQHILAR